MLSRGTAATAAAAGCIPLIIAALKTHAGCDSVASAACCALSSLSAHGDSAVIAAAGGVALVLAALATHGASRFAFAAATSALSALVVDAGSKAEAIAGGAPALIAAAAALHEPFDWAAGRAEAVLAKLA